MYKILSIFIIFALHGCNVGSNKHMVTLPSHGKVKNMKRDDSRVPILLFPDKAESYQETSYKYRIMHLMVIYIVV